MESTDAQNPRIIQKRDKVNDKDWLKTDQSQNGGFSSQQDSNFITRKFGNKEQSSHQYQSIVSIDKDKNSSI
jgi:hypothetical protein